MTVGDTLLQRFGLGPDDHIASAGESIVYALDDDRILRIQKSNELDYGVRKAQLCDEFRGQVPFALPKLLESGTVGSIGYTIEERIAGRSLDRILPSLEGRERIRALTAFADAGCALGHIRIDRPFYGELLQDPMIRCDTWTAYLLDRAAAQYARGGARLAADVPEAGRRFGAFRASIHGAPERPSGIAHGDLFPANVMVDDDLRLTGVLDFGFSTVVGDPRLDLVGASVFLEVERPWCRPGDAEVVRDYLHEQEPSLAQVEHLYRTYYAFYWAFTHEHGIPLYDWCVRELGGAPPADAG